MFYEVNQWVSKYPNEMQNMAKYHIMIRIFFTIHNTEKQKYVSACSAQPKAEPMVTAYYICLLY